MLFVISMIKGTDNLFSTYRICFAVLGIPALITIALVVLSKVRYPHPEMFEKAETEPNTKFEFRASFVLYMIAISLFAFGFADFTLITLHAAKTHLFPEASLSLLYAAAMAVDASAALFFGWLFDKVGRKLAMDDRTRHCALGHRHGRAGKHYESGNQSDHSEAHEKHRLRYL